ncbi:MAG: amino acid ABC transporter permease [Acidimicrobiales bacterium]
MSVAETPPAASSRPTSTRPPLWRDVRVVRVALQVVFVLAVVALVSYLYSNLIANLQARGIRTDFGYLSQPAGFQIQGSDFRASQSVRDALGVGLSNTLSVAGVGILLTTILGVIVGIASLSTNWLVRKAANVFVESLRNLPPLLVVIFTYFVVVLPLPRIQEAIDLGAVIISNRSIAIAAPALDDGSGAFLVVAALVCLVAAAVWVWRTRHNEATGEPHHRVLWAGGVLVGGLVVAWAAMGRPVQIDSPEVAGLQLAGGWTMSGFYVAVLLALVVYTASYIAEIVRGSIQAVHRGQTEAAEALALSSFQRLRFVILPQAFRIAVPPLGNQYLNLTKNSALAWAIGFAEVTSVTFIAVGNGSPAVQSVVLLLLIYLVLSLVISFFTNIVNRRLQVTER